MIEQIMRLEEYCLTRWQLRIPYRPAVGHRPWVPRFRPPAGEDELQMLLRKLGRTEHLGLMPSSRETPQHWGKGGAKGDFASDFLPKYGGMTVAQLPYTLLRTRRSGRPDGQPPAAHSPQARNVHCRRHRMPSCSTCLRLRRDAERCCAALHHRADHVARRDKSFQCELHRMNPCIQCRRSARGVRHCCEAGHHSRQEALPRHQKRGRAWEQGENTKRQKSANQCQGKKRPRDPEDSLVEEHRGGYSTFTRMRQQAEESSKHGRASTEIT